MPPTHTRRGLWIGLFAGTALLGLGATGLTLLNRAPKARFGNAVHPVTAQPILVPGKDGDSTVLHNGWRIQPVGHAVATGDMLLGGAVSPDGKSFAIANAGYGAHALHLFDLATEKETATVPLAKAWNGIAWAHDGSRLYVSGGVNNSMSDIYTVVKQDDGWKTAKGFRLEGRKPAATCVAGLALSSDGSLLYALNVSDDNLYVVETATGATKARLAVGDHPVQCRLTPDGRTLFVADWGGKEVAVVDMTDPLKPAVAAHIPTEDHPNDLVLATDGRLFVSCGNADAVTVLDSQQRTPLETIKVALTPNAPLGSTPNALALTPDNKTLYVANADNNAVCVVDVSSVGHSRVRGFVPTGWFPTAVAVSPDGKKLLIGSGKGSGTKPNLLTGTPRPDAPSGFRHIGNQLNGTVSFVATPNAAALAKYTKQVLTLSPYRDQQLTDARVSEQGRGAGQAVPSVIPTRVGAPSPIKYVLYIIKENRTYDQVFGDLPKGNGDPKLTLFGRDVTPNHHALAEQFVLLDNLYCNGEVSADGHPWSTAAYCTDYDQRAWVLSYSGKGAMKAGRTVTDSKSGFFWELCARKGVSFRSYGEMKGHPSLEGHESLEYIGKGAPGSAPPGRDTDKADIFIKEFKEYERTGTMPRFTVMSLGEDHTNGTRPGAHTPKAMVASNDQALGKIVQAVSTSSLWKEFAIFVIEDDAQNGPDHVDSHRTAGLVISPYTRRGSLDSTLYTTASVLRTMELILGLPPLTQHDAAATPMFACFTDKADTTPYKLLAAQIDLNAKNTATAYGAQQSAKMDWREYDRIDEDALNRILWHSIKGRNVPMPAPVRRALIAPNGTLHAQPVARKDADD